MQCLVRESGFSGMGMVESWNGLSINLLVRFVCYFIFCGLVFSLPVCLFLLPGNVAVLLLFCSLPRLNSVLEFWTCSLTWQSIYDWY